MFEDVTGWCPKCEAHVPFKTVVLEGSNPRLQTAVCVTCVEPITDVTFPRQHKKQKDTTDV